MVARQQDLFELFTFLLFWNVLKLEHIYAKDVPP